MSALGYRDSTAVVNKEGGIMSLRVWPAIFSPFSLFPGGVLISAANKRSLVNLVLPDSFFRASFPLLTECWDRQDAEVRTRVTDLTRSNVSLFDLS